MPSSAQLRYLHDRYPDDVHTAHRVDGRWFRLSRTAFYRVSLSVIWFICDLVCSSCFVRRWLGPGRHAMQRPPPRLSLAGLGVTTSCFLLLLFGFGWVWGSRRAMPPASRRSGVKS